MTEFHLLERAYETAFWQGLRDRLEVAAVRALFGEDSTEYSLAHIKHDSSLALARDSIDEVTHPLNLAAWTGYIDGSRRYAAVGSPSLPSHIGVPPPETLRPRSPFELVYDEINGWMPEFTQDLPRVVEMIKLGVRGVDSRSEFSEVFSFFETLVQGVDHVSGNFGDDFSDADRKIVNDFVNGDWDKAVELVERGWLKQEGRTN